MEKRFTVKFTIQARKEYDRLDASIIGEVNTALETLEYSADMVGKRLGKKREVNLTGTKERKLRSPGIRIIYQITDRRAEILEIVEVLLVDFKRNETDIYKEAQERLRYERLFGSLSDDQPELFWTSKPAEDEAVLNTPSMIDQIFDEKFDELGLEVQREIIDYYSYGDIDSAYRVWLRARGFE